MGKQLKIKNRTTGRDDEYVIEIDDNGTRTELLLATDTESGAGTANNKIVTPKALASTVPAATDAVAGKVELATSAETTAGSSSTLAVTPAGLAATKNATMGVLESSKTAVVGDKGQLDWSGIVPTYATTTGRDNAFIKMGTWATPITIVQTDDHFVPLQINIKKSGNIQFDTAAARLRVDTNGAQALSAVGCLQLRQNLAHNVGSGAFLNASVNVSAAVTVGLGSVLGGYFSIEGSGAITKAGANDCTALVAVNNMASTGSGLDNVFIAMQNGTGSTVTDIAKIVCTHGTATNGLHIYNTATDGTMTTAIKIFGAITNAFDFTGASTCILEDNKSAPTVAGSIKILTPAGSVAYINYYDGTRST